MNTSNSYAMLDISEVTLYPFPDDIEILHSKNKELNDTNTDLTTVCIVLGIVFLTIAGFVFAGEINKINTERGKSSGN